MYRGCRGTKLLGKFSAEFAAGLQRVVIGRFAAGDALADKVQAAIFAVLFPRAHPFAVAPAIGAEERRVLAGEGALDRLEHKGAVAETEGKNPNGRAVRLYRPLVEKTPAAAKETESFLDRVWDGSLAMLVSSLVGEKKLSEDEIEELRKIIDEAEKGERK